jgi:hypothetical protein
MPVTKKWGQKCQYEVYSPQTGAAVLPVSASCKSAQASHVAGPLVYATDT